MDSDLAESVVIFDNEDQVDITNKGSTLGYYVHLFEEMMKPGPAGVPAVRPGFYSHSLQASPIIALVPDLFLWDQNSPDRIDKDRIKLRPAPPPDKPNQRPVPDPALIYPCKDDLQNQRVDLQVDWWTINLNHSLKPSEVNYDGKPVQTNNQGSGDPSQYAFGSIPLGRQTYFWKKQGSPRAKLGQLTPQNNCDMDISLVRDPRYPHAEPRFSVSPNVLVQGYFVKKDIGMDCSVRNLGLQQTTKPFKIGGLALEPEAPLALLSNGAELFSIAGGQIVRSIQSSGQWGDFVGILTSPSSSNATAAGAAKPQPSSTPKQNVLRRLRALHAIDRGSDAYLFFVSTNFQVVTRRRLANSNAAWSNSVPLQMTGSGGLHQLSNISVTSSRRSIDIFFIHSNGLLTTSAPLLPNTKNYPAQNCLVLEQTPGFLIGTALTAVSPSDSFVLVFGVSRYLQLRFGVWKLNQGWSPIQNIGAPSVKIFVHSRLSAYIPKNNPTIIYVAAVSDQNVPVVYPIQFNKNSATWVLGKRQLYAKKIQKAPPGLMSSDPIASARDYGVNPFGDIRIFEDAKSLAIAVPGINSSRATILVNHFTQSGGWESWA